jgi:hypothetical protein
MLRPNFVIPSHDSMVQTNLKPIKIMPLALVYMLLSVLQWQYLRCLHLYYVCSVDVVLHVAAVAAEHAVKMAHLEDVNAASQQISNTPKQSVGAL